MLLIEQDIKDIEDGLESWDWLNYSEMKPFITTAFGDVFFEASDGIYFLDSIGATFEKVAESKLELQKILNTRDGQDHFLMVGLVMAARDMGLTLGKGECYDFKVSPALSGPMGVDNIQIMSFKVSLNMSGQIQKQIKDLPPGTKIESIKFSGA